MCSVSTPGWRRRATKEHPSRASPRGTWPGTPQGAKTGNGLPEPAVSERWGMPHRVLLRLLARWGSPVPRQNPIRAVHAASRHLATRLVGCEDGGLGRHELRAPGIQSGPPAPLRQQRLWRWLRAACREPGRSRRSCAEPVRASIRRLDLWLPVVSCPLQLVEHGMHIRPAPSAETVWRNC